MRYLPLVLGVVLGGCGSAPPEPAPNSEPPPGTHESVAPLTRVPSGPPAARVAARRFQLPDNPTGQALGRYIDSQVRLMGEPARVEREASLAAIRERPDDTVDLVRRVYGATPKTAQNRRYEIAMTLAELGLDEALPLLSEMADEFLAEDPRVESLAPVAPISGPPEPSAADSTRGLQMSAGAAIEGIGLIARSTTTLGKKAAAMNQLKGYFTNQYAFIKESATIQWLRACSNGATPTAACKTQASSLLATADRYIVNLTLGKTPRSGVRWPANPKPKAGQTPVVLPPRR